MSSATLPRRSWLRASIHAVPVRATSGEPVMAAAGEVLRPMVDPGERLLLTEPRARPNRTHAATAAT